jgi:hypothetical protein
MLKIQFDIGLEMEGVELEYGSHLYSWNQIKIIF